MFEPLTYSESLFWVQDVFHLLHCGDLQYLCGSIPWSTEPCEKTRAVKSSDPEIRHLPDVSTPQNNPNNGSSFKSVSMRIFWRQIAALVMDIGGLFRHML